jgi:hypothetical protein
MPEPAAAGPVKERRRGSTPEPAEKAAAGPVKERAAKLTATGQKKKKGCGRHEKEDQEVSHTGKFNLTECNHSTSTFSFSCFCLSSPYYLLPPSPVYEYIPLLLPPASLLYSSPFSILLFFCLLPSPSFHSRHPSFTVSFLLFL